MKKLALALMLTCLTSAAAFTVGRSTATRLEDCIQYDPSLLRIEDMGERGWHLTAGRIWLHIFDSREDAEAGLASSRESKMCNHILPAVRCQHLSPLSSIRDRKST